jgi:hypothetical protein
MFIHILTLSVVIRRNSIKSHKILHNVTKPHAHALSRIATDHRIDAVLLKTSTLLYSISIPRITRNMGQDGDGHAHFDQIWRPNITINNMGVDQNIKF